jgi:hypothetical protein
LFQIKLPKARASASLSHQRTRDAGRPDHRKSMANCSCYVSFMCGRYTHLLTWQQIVNLYRITLPEEPPAPLTPSYNVDWKS